MATELQHHHVQELNNKTIEYVSYPRIGAKWVKCFLAQHSELKSTTRQSINAAKVKDASSEILTRWLKEYDRMMQKYNIEVRKHMQYE
jgi:hypothetical protein